MLVRKFKQLGDLEIQGVFLLVLPRKVLSKDLVPPKHKRNTLYSVYDNLSRQVTKFVKTPTICTDDNCNSRLPSSEQDRDEENNFTLKSTESKKVKISDFENGGGS